MDYLNTINDLYPVRRLKEEKENFINYIKEETKKYNISCNLETLENKHNNIVIGNLETAKVVYTAHYDTPASSLLPNMMMPRNMLFGYLYVFGYPILIALFSLGVSYGISSLLSLEYRIWALLFLIIYFCLFYLVTRAFTNKHNKNDNTSGVACIMTILSKCNSNDVCFVLFDNEEKGLLGSRAFNKAHKELLKDKLIINMDCVGVGNNVILIAKDNAKNHPLYNKLNQTFISNIDFNVLYFGTRGSMSNSDYKNFENGIGIMTCKKAKIIGYYTGRIHTNYDTIADIRNIEFISEQMIKFIELI